MRLGTIMFAMVLCAACAASQPDLQHVTPDLQRLVVFQKWRWTGINVTLGLIFIASLRKEWPMTFIAVRCPHGQSDQIVKRGQTAREA